MRSRKFIYLLVILLVFTNTVYTTSVSATEMDENEVVIVDNTSGEDGEGGASSNDGTDGNMGNNLIEDNADNQSTEITEDDELNLDSQGEANDGVSSENKNVSNDDVPNEEQNTSSDDVSNENSNTSSDDEILDENNEEPVANSFMLQSVSLMSDDGIMLMDSDDNDTYDLTSNVYEQSISSADDLADLADIVNNNNNNQYSSFQITVTADINLSDLSSGKTFTSIGTEANPFIGTFEGKDGNNKTITLNGQSLFGVVGSDDSDATTISNITVIGSDFTSSTEKNTGALIQKATNTTISSCTNNVDVTSSYSDDNSDSKDSVGGIVGYGSNVTINKCENYGDIKGTTYVGGIIGYANTDVTLYGCTNSDTVTGAYAGGMIGKGVAVSLTYCINSAKITGTTSVGGMIGDASSSSVIKFCLNSGNVVGGTNAGGMIGHGDGTSSTNFCYNSGTITGANAGNTIGKIGYDDTDGDSTGNWFILTSPSTSCTWNNKEISIDLTELTEIGENNYKVTYELPSSTNREILNDDGETETITDEKLKAYDVLDLSTNDDEHAILTLRTATDTLSPGTYTYYIYLTCNNITKSQTLTIIIDAREFSSSDFTFNEKSLSEVTTAGLSYNGTDDSTYVTVTSDIWKEDTDYTYSCVFDPVTWTTTMTITPVTTMVNGVTVYPTGMSDTVTSLSNTFAVAKRTSNVVSILSAGTSYRFPWDMVGMINPDGNTDGCTYTTGNYFYVATTGNYTYTVSVK